MTSDETRLPVVSGVPVLSLEGGSLLARLLISLGGVSHALQNKSRGEFFSTTLYRARPPGRQEDSVIEKKIDQPLQPLQCATILYNPFQSYHPSPLHTQSLDKPPQGCTRVPMCSNQQF